MNIDAAYGIFLIVLGALYLFKPKIVPHVGRQLFSEEVFRRYMQVAGVLSILLGAALIVYSSR